MSNRFVHSVGMLLVSGVMFCLVNADEGTSSSRFPIETHLRNDQLSAAMKMEQNATVDVQLLANSSNGSSPTTVSSSPTSNAPISTTSTMPSSAHPSSLPMPTSTLHHSTSRPTTAAATPQPTVSNVTNSTSASISTESVASSPRLSSSNTPVISSTKSTSILTSTMTTPTNMSSAPPQNASQLTTLTTPPGSSDVTTVTATNTQNATHETQTTAVATSPSPFSSAISSTASTSSLTSAVTVPTKMSTAPPQNVSQSTTLATPPGSSTVSEVTATNTQNATQETPTAAAATSPLPASDASTAVTSTEGVSSSSVTSTESIVEPNTSSTSSASTDGDVSTTTTTTTSTATPTNGVMISDFSNLPKSERMVFAIIAIPALVFGMTAFKYLKLTVFFAGWAALGYAFYVFSPLAFKSTPVCCGANGTKLGHVGVSIGAGLLGGLITLKLLRLGLFAVGACMGLLVGVIIIYTPLHNEAFFSTNYGFTVYYASFAFVFGVVAMFAEKHTIVFSSALAGSFVFALGVDYFAQTGFSEIVASVLLAAESRMKEEVEHHKTTGHDVKQIYSPDGHRAYYMLGGWIGVWVLSVLVQYRLMYHKPKPKDGRERRRQMPNDGDYYDDRDDALLLHPPVRGRSRRSAPRRSRYADDDEVFQWSSERVSRRPSYRDDRAYDQRWASSTDPTIDRYDRGGRYSEDFIELRDYY